MFSRRTIEPQIYELIALPRK